MKSVWPCCVKEDIIKRISSEFRRPTKIMRGIEKDMGILNSGISQPVTSWRVDSMQAGSKRGSGIGSKFVGSI